MENPQVHVKITINDLYKEQQETNKLLIQLAAELKSLANLPEEIARLDAELSKLKLSQAENSWIPKVVWAAMASSMTGFVMSIWQLLGGSNG